MVRAGSIVFAFMLASGCTHSSTESICRTQAIGHWIIASYSFAEVAAVTEADVRGNLGKSVDVSPKKVVFAGDICRVVRTETDYSDKDDLDAEPGYPLNIDYECANGVYIPSFSVGKSCDIILAGIDGVEYTLKRK